MHNSRYQAAVKAATNVLTTAADTILYKFAQEPVASQVKFMPPNPGVRPQTHTPDAPNTGPAARTNPAYVADKSPDHLINRGIDVLNRGLTNLHTVNSYTQSPILPALDSASRWYDSAFSKTAPLYFKGREPQFSLPRGAFSGAAAQVGGTPNLMASLQKLTRPESHGLKVDNEPLITVAGVMNPLTRVVPSNVPATQQIVKKTTGQMPTSLNLKVMQKSTPTNVVYDDFLDMPTGGTAYRTNDMGKAHVPPLQPATIRGEWDLPDGMYSTHTLPKVLPKAESVLPPQLFDEWDIAPGLHTPRDAMLDKYRHNSTISVPPSILDENIGQPPSLLKNLYKFKLGLKPGDATTPFTGNAAAG